MDTTLRTIELSGSQEPFDGTQSVESICIASVGIVSTHISQAGSIPPDAKVHPANGAVLEATNDLIKLGVITLESVFSRRRDQMEMFKHLLKDYRFNREVVEEIEIPEFPASLSAAVIERLRLRAGTS